ncbi:MAG TPA: beta-galactosidase trimerization domain-containing protein, partial [Armatimonadota bacterium]|nr:beta-galactosidase trimerization domain-containing protein [Armatimonadota bacterium]
TLEGRDGQIESVRDAWVKMLEDLGLQYDFVSYKQIEDGKLDGGQYKLLILPVSLAISEQEAEAIRRFVQGGGTVLADMNCGRRDGHCKPVQPGMLDELFGIARGDAGQAPASSIIAQADLGADLPAGTEVRVTLPEAGLRATATKPLALSADDVRAPALMVNDVGRGQAMYMNLDLSQFDTERKFRSPTERQLRAAVLALLAQAGIEPIYEVSYESGKAPHVEVVRYALGDVTILGLMRVRSDGDDEVATIKLPRPVHVYSMRQQKYLGETDTITAPMASGQAFLYCLSPTQLGGPSVKVAGDARRGQVVSYQVGIEGGPDAPQVVHVTVENPEGNAVADYAQNLVVRGGQAAGDIPLALDDAPGTWTVRAESILSGRAARATFEVAGG